MPPATASSTSAKASPRAAPRTAASRGASDAIRRPPRIPTTAIPTATPSPANSPTVYQSDIEASLVGGRFAASLRGEDKGDDRPIRGVRPLASEPPRLLLCPALRPRP